MAVCQNLVPLVNIKIAGKWMFIPLKMVLIGIDPYPHSSDVGNQISKSEDGVLQSVGLRHVRFAWRFLLRLCPWHLYLDLLHGDAWS